MHSRYAGLKIQSLQYKKYTYNSYLYDSLFLCVYFQERTKANQAHAGGLPGMGGPGMVPHHNYPIPSENFHSGGRLYARPGLGPLMGQSLAMGQMGPPLQRGISNDLGPPIFMPCEYFNEYFK